MPKPLPVVTENKCGRCEKPGEPDHSCPFAEEIHDNYDKQCNCCDECRHECLMDI